MNLNLTRKRKSCHFPVFGGASSQSMEIDCLKIIVYNTRENDELNSCILHNSLQTIDFSQLTPRFSRVCYHFFSGLGS